MSCYHARRSLALVSFGIVLIMASVADARLLVTNYFESSVDIYDETSGAVLQSGFITSSVATPLGFPAGVAVGPDGNLYVSSSATGKVLVYDTLGQPLATAPGGAGVYADLGSSAMPSALAFDSSGKLYVADNGGDAVHIFDGSSAAAIATIQGPGGTPFLQPGGLKFDSGGRLFISSFNGHQLFIHDGGTVSEFTSPGEGGLVLPGGIEIAADGSVYVASIFGNGIFKFDSAGNPIPGSGGPGTPFITIPFTVPPAASFSPSNAPSDLEIDVNGDLLISVLGPTNPLDEFNGLEFPLGGLLRYTTGGSLETLVYPIGSASSLALWPELDSAAATPEPSTAALALVAAALIGGWGYFRRRHGIR